MTTVSVSCSAANCLMSAENYIMWGNTFNIRVATKSYNIKLVIGITWVNVNHSSPALERSVINQRNNGPVNAHLIWTVLLA